jgi:uncharacterized protein YjiS (DUF1127 family)
MKGSGVLNLRQSRRTDMTMIANQVRDGFVTNLGNAKSHRPLWAEVGAAIDAFVTALLDWQEQARQRRQLLGLSDRALQDFGRSRADATREGDRTFWRA